MSSPTYGTTHLDYRKIEAAMNISMREVPKLHVGMVVYVHLSTTLVTYLVR
jgi:hypothetical protein